MAIVVLITITLPLACDQRNELVQAVQNACGGNEYGGSGGESSDGDSCECTQPSCGSCTYECTASREVCAAESRAVAEAKAARSAMEAEYRIWRNTEVQAGTVARHYEQEVATTKAQIAEARTRYQDSNCYCYQTVCGPGSQPIPNSCYLPHTGDSPYQRLCNDWSCVGASSVDWLSIVPCADEARLVLDIYEWTKTNALHIPRDKYSAKKLLGLSRTEEEDGGQICTDVGVTCAQNLIEAATEPSTFRLSKVVTGSIGCLTTVTNPVPLAWHVGWTVFEWALTRQETCVGNGGTWQKVTTTCDDLAATIRALEAHLPEAEASAREWRAKEADAREKADAAHDALHCQQPDPPGGPNTCGLTDPPLRCPGGGMGLVQAECAAQEALSLCRLLASLPKLVSCPGDVDPPTCNTNPGSGSGSGSGD